MNYLNSRADAQVEALRLDSRVASKYPRCDCRWDVASWPVGVNYANDDILWEMGAPYGVPCRRCRLVGRVAGTPPPFLTAHWDRPPVPYGPYLVDTWDPFEVPE